MRMLQLMALFLLGAAHAVSPHRNVRAVTTEDEARQLMAQLDTRGSQECTATVKASWAYSSDITEEHKAAQLAASLKHAEWIKEQWEKVKAVPKSTWEKYQDEDLKRKFKLMSILGLAALSIEDFTKYNTLVTKMSEIYSKAKICDFRNTEKCDLALEPDLTRIMRNSRDYEELEYVWTSWRNETGKLMRDNYKEFVHLANKAAEMNDFDNMGDMWTYGYETDNFKDEMENLWDQLKPLYEQVHAYIRRKLMEMYGEDRISKRGPIPAHLLGNMWSQTWGQIYDFVIPYPGKTSVDVTSDMVKQKYTPKRMFELSDEFFTSLNLTAMPPKFWEDSIIEKPEGRELTCHASAWDFCNGQDFRIKQCTDVTMDDLITVHHEMGHIQYFLQYKDLHQIFREGANPGFHEAVGDVLALSVATPKHLKKIGLLQEVQNDDEADINFLMSMALDKIVFLPFGYLMDKWRWDVFSGETEMKDRNCHWWDLRYKIQGIKPPTQRSEADFDPGAKYHIPANVPYIRYFVSFVIQFQFHKSLCLLANEYDPQDPMKPLHRCDIYQSTKAGNALGDMLKLGASKPWTEAMKALTGGEKMDASVIREYFSPLEKWLMKENKKHGAFIGWEKDEDEEYCISDTSGATVNQVYVMLILPLLCILINF